MTAIQLITMDVLPHVLSRVVLKIVAAMDGSSHGLILLVQQRVEMVLSEVQSNVMIVIQ